MVMVVTSKGRWRLPKAFNVAQRRVDHALYMSALNLHLRIGHAIPWPVALFVTKEHL
jgi:hypothetical protein